MKNLIYIVALIGAGWCQAQLTEQHSVYFNVDKHLFKAGQDAEFNAFLDDLLYKPLLDVKILGYCDDRGSYDYNMALSNRRVETVSQHLQEHSIDITHILKKVEGRGEVALSATGSEDVSGERAQNRRVDIIFSLKKDLVDRIAIKKLNREELNKREEELIDAYEEKAVKQLTKNPDTVLVTLEEPTEPAPPVAAEDEYMDIPTKLDPPIDNTKEPFKTLLSKKLKQGQVIKLENILFYKGRSTILKESQPLLDRVAEILKAREDIEFEIHGHVCCINPYYDDAYNRDTKKNFLSRDRARTIYKILTRRGINTSRMKYKGFGRTKPLGGPDKQDRRVELYITKINNGKK